MVHTTVNELSIREVEHYGLSDDYLYREMCRKLISDLPMEDLKKIFKFRKVDPRDLNDVMMNPKSTDSDRMEISLLEEKGVIKYETRITI